MNAVITKFLSPTNTRGSRVKATYWDGSVTVPYRHNMSGKDAHFAAVEVLLKKHFDTTGVKFSVVSGGAMPDGTGYAFIIK